MIRGPSGKDERRAKSRWFDNSDIDGNAGLGGNLKLVRSSLDHAQYLREISHGGRKGLGRGRAHHEVDVGDRLLHPADTAGNGDSGVRRQCGLEVIYQATGDGKGRPEEEPPGASLYRVHGRKDVGFRFGAESWQHSDAAGLRGGDQPWEVDHAQFPINPCRRLDSHPRNLEEVEQCRWDRSLECFQGRESAREYQGLNRVRDATAHAWKSA